MMKKNSAVLTYVLIVLLGMLLAVNYSLFIVPNGFAPAGINGIAVMIQYKLGISIGYLSLLINIPLCIIAFFTIRRQFAVQTLLFCLTYSLSYLYLQSSGLLARFAYNADGVDTIYPVILAGLCSGFVCGVLFQKNCCSGGTDIIGRFVSVKKPTLNFFWVTFTLNATVAFASYFVYAKEVDGVLQYNMKPVCLCLLYCFLTSFIANFVMKQSSAAQEFVVITQHPEQVEPIIVEQMHHSATKIAATGVYTGKEKTVLMCVLNKHQSVEFMQAVAHIPSTFVFENTVGSVAGNFKKIK